MAQVRGGLYECVYTLEGKRRRQKVSIPTTAEADGSKVVDECRAILVAEHAVPRTAVVMQSITPLHRNPAQGGKEWLAEPPKKGEVAKETPGVPSKAGIRKMGKSDLLSLAKKTGIAGVDKQMKLDDMRSVVIRHFHDR